MAVPSSARTVLDAPCRVRRTDGGWTVLVDVPRSRDGDLTVHLLREAHLSVHSGWLYDQFADGCRRLRAAVV